VLDKDRTAANLSDNAKKVANTFISPERDVRQFTEGVEGKLRNRQD